MLREEHGLQNKKKMHKRSFDCAPTVEYYYEKFTDHISKYL